MIAPAPFHARRWLGNGHLQTIAGNFLHRAELPSRPRTELINVPLPPEMQLLPEAVALDAALPSRVLCHTHFTNPPTATTVILVHGLEGSSHSQYIRGNTRKLMLAGHNVIRMNMRNCGSTDALSPTLYHSGLSTDVIAVLQWAIARGCTRIVLAGYSMGGNMALKAAGELALNAPPELLGVVAVSPPMDLRESADALHLPLNRIYERRFLRSLIARYRRKMRLFPATYTGHQLHRIHSIRDFDEHMMAPHCGFSGADDYYARSGASRVLANIAVPTLVLHALDDPFIRLTAATRATLASHPLITLKEPAHGGHCAFLEQPTPNDQAAQNYDGYWAERELATFVQICGNTPAPLRVPLQR